MALRSGPRAAPRSDLAERALGESLRAYTPPHPGGYVDFRRRPSRIDRREPRTQQLAKLAVVDRADEHFVDALPAAALLDTAAGVRPVAGAELGHPLRRGVDHERPGRQRLDERTVTEVADDRAPAADRVSGRRAADT